MDENEDGLTIEELAAEVGLSVRAVRFYITEKLLPPLGSRGKGAVWGEDHLLRLRLIRGLTERRLTLAEIRDRLANLSTADVRALLAEEGRQSQAPARTLREPSAKEYLATLLRQARAARAPTPPSAPSALSPGAPTAPTPVSGAPVPPAEGAPFDAAPGWYARTAPGQGAVPTSRAAGPPSGAFAARSALPRHKAVESAAGYAEAVQSDGSNRWVRHQLAPGVELHVREDALPSQRPLIDRLLAAAQSASGDEAESRSGLERNE